ncbi:hypothetical protein FEFB_05680 [Fructobacillus sp. EFB-N1]|uniref:hypothetical protein n=1 Tax=Fructobacillus sp. EFB-N1 TaxID=1658766 RepID=UPI00064DB292|nr:hypothetical protein [Fructobacillus sp. EFB-N1]KMK53633.1 hypothetical protein FEFB_05680 [Fructobacillus sp. EFB-N1]
MNRLVAKLHKKLEFKSSKRLTKKQRQFYQELHYYFRGETEADFSNLYYIEGFTGDELDTKIKENLIKKITTMQLKIVSWSTIGHDNRTDVTALIKDYQSMIYLLSKYTNSLEEFELYSVSILYQI